jgi:hypothetical protein
VALGTSETAAFQIAAMHLLKRRPVHARFVAPRRKRGRGLVPAGLAVSYEDADRYIEQKASALRRKFKRKRDADAAIVAWRLLMKQAFILALAARRGQDPFRCRLWLRDLTAAAGEEEYGAAFLDPLLVIRLSSDPLDFTPDVTV